MERFRFGSVLLTVLAAFSCALMSPIFSQSPDSTPSKCSPPDQVLCEIFMKAKDKQSETGEPSEVNENIRQIINFDGISEPTWKSEAEFSKDFNQEESPIRAAKRMALYHRKHSDSLKFIATSSLNLMFENPGLRPLLSETIDIFRRFYLGAMLKLSTQGFL